jgi:hypothetical protein
MACSRRSIPGISLLPLFQALDESKRLPLFMLSHEPGSGLPPTTLPALHPRPPQRS